MKICAVFNLPIDYEVDYQRMSCLKTICVDPTCRKGCPFHVDLAFLDDYATIQGCDGVFCPTCQHSHVCVPSGIVLRDFPACAEVRVHRPRSSGKRGPRDRRERSRSTRYPFTLADGRRKPTLAYPLERSPAVIRAWTGPRGPSTFVMELITTCPTSCCAMRSSQLW